LVYFFFLVVGDHSFCNIVLKNKRLVQYRTNRDIFGRKITKKHREKSHLSIIVIKIREIN